MAQQFTVKPCSYPLGIRGGTAALYSCTGHALYNVKGCQLHHHPCNGARVAESMGLAEKGSSV